MRAVIMAGGRGTRLAPFTKVLPKPLIPLGDYPILEIILCQLRSAGFSEVTLTLGYLAQLFQAYFGNGERLGIQVNYAVEPHRMGTAGALRLIDHLDEPFLLMNADVLTNLNFVDMVDFHLRHKAAITMALYPREVQVDFGVIELDDTSHVVGFREKPHYSFLINMGIYIVNPEVLDYLPSGQYYDFPDLVEVARTGGHNVLGYVFDGDWMDLGRIEDFTKASDHYHHLASCAEERVALEELLEIPADSLAVR